MAKRAWYVLMFQTDLFATRDDVHDLNPVLERLPAPAKLPALIDHLTLVSERPRYALMVLNLIAKAAGASGAVGPYVREGDENIAVRDWLCDAVIPVAQRNHRRLAVVEKVRRELVLAEELPRDAAAAERLIDDRVQERVRRSQRCSISRAVSELVKAGLVTRHYQGYRVDHHNRGAQRQAVYTVTPEARRAIRNFV